MLIQRPDRLASMPTTLLTAKKVIVGIWREEVRAMYSFV